MTCRGSTSCSWTWIGPVSTWSHPGSTSRTSPCRRPQTWNSRIPGEYPPPGRDPMLCVCVCSGGDGDDSMMKNDILDSQLFSLTLFCPVISTLTKQNSSNWPHHVEACHHQPCCHIGQYILSNAVYTLWHWAWLCCCHWAAQRTTLCILSSHPHLHMLSTRFHKPHHLVWDALCFHHFEQLESLLAMAMLCIGRQHRMFDWNVGGPSPTGHACCTNWSACCAPPSLLVTVATDPSSHWPLLPPLPVCLTKVCCLVFFFFFFRCGDEAILQSVKISWLQSAAFGLNEPTTLALLPPPLVFCILSRSLLAATASELIVKSLSRRLNIKLSSGSWTTSHWTTATWQLHNWQSVDVVQKGHCATRLLGGQAHSHELTHRLTHHNTACLPLLLFNVFLVVKVRVAGCFSSTGQSVSWGQVVVEKVKGQIPRCIPLAARFDPRHHLLLRKPGSCRCSRRRWRRTSSRRLPASLSFAWPTGCCWEWFPWHSSCPSHLLFFCCWPLCLVAACRDKQTNKTIQVYNYNSVFRKTRIAMEEKKKKKKAAWWGRCVPEREMRRNIRWQGWQPSWLRVKSPTWSEQKWKMEALWGRAHQAVRIEFEDTIRRRQRLHTWTIHVYTILNKMWYKMIYLNINACIYLHHHTGDNVPSVTNEMPTQLPTGIPTMRTIHNSETH